MGEVEEINSSDASQTDESTRLVKVEEINSPDIVEINDSIVKVEDINPDDAIQIDTSVVEVNLDAIEQSRVVSADQVDGPKRNYAAKRNAAEGMMDIALLTANANQLRFLITYNSTSSTFYISLGLIILSLILQVAVGIALIFKQRKADKAQRQRTNQFLVCGVFMVTFVNILVAALTSTETS